MISKQELEWPVQIDTIIESMKKMEDKDVVKVLLDDVKLAKSKDGGYTAIITFNLLNRVEKEIYKETEKISIK